MTPADVTFLSETVRARSGLVLTPDKSYLLQSRLTPVARREGYESLEAMIAALRAKPSDRLAWAITEAMTTNETFFFRDKLPFDTFRNHVLPNLVATRRPTDTLRIWCAACSTGQEPYSLAMILEEERAKVGARRVEITATDLCTKALEKAQAGLYSQFEVQRGLPVQLLVNYFEKVDDMWRIAPSLKRSIQFRKFNLLDPYRGMPQFDVIFCRNVLIYFDQPTKKSVLDRMAAQSAKDGYLFLGAAETVMGLCKDFENVKGQRALYQRTASQAGVRAA